MKNIKQIREEFNNIEGPIVEDHEFSMARSELKSIIDNAQHLLGLLKGEGDLEAWMQSKITKAADYLTAVHDNIASGESDIKEDHEEKEAEKASFDKKIPLTFLFKLSPVLLTTSLLVLLVKPGWHITILKLFLKAFNKLKLVLIAGF